MSSETDEQPSKLDIAVLDDYASIASKYFEAIPTLTIHDFPTTLNPTKGNDLQELITRLKPYSIISSMRERTAFSVALLKELSNLKLLLTTGMRNAAIDLDAARELGIVVTGTKGDRPAPGFEPQPAGFSGVNQHAWALLLSLCGRIPEDDRALNTCEGAWQSGLGISLAGKTLGLLGLGKLGIAMGKTALLAFGMKVIAWSENLTQEKADAAAQSAGLEGGVFRVVGKDELFRGSDVVSLHYVLSSRSRGIVGEKELALMKRSAVLLNTSRGGLIDEAALIQTLKDGRIRGVALDVFWEEPISADSPWRKADDWAKSAVVLSPHMGYVNADTLEAMYAEQAEVLRGWLENKDEVRNRLN